MNITIEIPSASFQFSTDVINTETGDALALARAKGIVDELLPISQTAFKTRLDAIKFLRNAYRHAYLVGYAAGDRAAKDKGDKNA